GFTTIVDAKKCKMYIHNFGEFYNNQIEHASSIIFSHTTGLSQEKLDDCVALIREYNGDASIVTTPWEEITGKQILETMEKKSTIQVELEHLEHEEHDHHHDDDCTCGCHDHEEHEHHHQSRS
ncbi:MAG: cobalamin biosynthesis protein CobW, partial [Anaerovoracaceae bacterium]